VTFAGQLRIEIKGSIIFHLTLDSTFMFTHMSPAGTMNHAIKDRVVRFAGTKEVVVLLHSNRPRVEAGWYSKNDLELFKALFEISVAEIRVQFSKGGIDALTMNEIVGLEKKLTRGVSEQIMPLNNLNLLITSCSSRYFSSQGNTTREG
jgi:hypothetical protein